MQLQPGQPASRPREASPEIAGARRAADGCGDPVFIVDEHLVLVHWNPAAELAFGVPAAAAVGRLCFDVIAGKTSAGRPLCHAYCEKWALARRGARVHGFDLCAFPGRAVWLSVSILPIPGPAGV